MPELENKSIVKKHVEDSFSIELFNEEESQRIGDNVKELLGVIAKLGSKLPKPVLVSVLVLIFSGAVLGEGDLLQRSGTLWTILFDTQNISLLLKSVTYGLGLLGVFNMSNLYRKVDRAARTIDPDFIVRRTIDPNIELLQSSNTLLNAKNLVLEDQLSTLQSKISENQNFIHGLVGVIQDLSLAQSANPKAQEVLLQAMKYVDSYSSDVAKDSSKDFSRNFTNDSSKASEDSSSKILSISEAPSSLISEVPQPAAVKQSLRVMSQPGKGWSKVQAISDLDSASDHERAPSLLSV